MRPLAIALALLMAPCDALAAGDWSWPVHGDVVTAYRNGADRLAAVDSDPREVKIRQPVAAICRALRDGEAGGPHGPGVLDRPRRGGHNRRSHGCGHVDPAVLATGIWVGPVAVGGHELPDDGPRPPGGSACIRWVRERGDRDARHEREEVSATEMLAAYAHEGHRKGVSAHRVLARAALSHAVAVV